jgi:LysM repeat protein
MTAVRILINVLAILALIITLLAGVVVYNQVAGRTKSQTQAEAQGAAPCQPRADWTSYSVGSGETIEAIAARHGISVVTLAIANCLDSPTLTANQDIVVPSAPASVAP